jgi:hypothetical protein
MTLDDQIIEPQQWLKDARSYARILWGYEELIDDLYEVFVALQTTGIDPLTAVKAVGKKYELIPVSDWV